MKSNGEAFKQFITKLIDNPETMPQVKALLIKMRDDEEFWITYLQCTSILMVRFPSLFDKLLKGAHEHVLTEMRKKINENMQPSINN